MRDRIQHAAVLVVGRDCAMAGIVVLACMASWRTDTPHTLEFGGWLCLALCGLLILRGLLVWSASYALIDVWEMLGPERINATATHLLIGSTLRQLYFTGALQAAHASLALLITGLAWALLSP
jgi:hypothetical protein